MPAAQSGSGVPDTSLLDQLAEELNEPEPTSEASDRERLDELEKRLADREKLVGILTERLEKAADELDRVKRTGGVGARESETTDVAGLLEEQHSVGRKVDDFFSAWEERYEGPSLRRIEAGIEELREQLGQMGTPQRSSRSADSLRPGSLLSEFQGASEGTSDRESEDRALEQQDARDIGSSNEGFADSRANGQTAARAFPNDQPVRFVLISDAEEIPDELEVSLPEPVDEDASAEELQQAVADRDQYIAWLCGQVRKIAGRLELWMVGLREESSDDGLRRQVEGMEQLIRDQLRLAEVELSIERARLSRQQARIQQEAEELEREREKVARLLQQDRTDDEAPLLRRWRKFIRPQGE